MDYILLVSIVALILFSVLKLLGVIALSWWWLAIPGAVMVVALLFIGFIIVAVSRGP